MKYSLKNSLALIVFGILLPEFITFLYNITNNNDFQFTFQYITGFIVFFCSSWLLVLSIRGIQGGGSLEKFERIVCILLSIFFLLYICLALYLQLALRNGFVI